MTAAAWVALAGIIVTGLVMILTNVIIITRFLSTLERRLGEWREKVNGELAVIRTQHTALVESTNVATGSLRMTQERTEERHDRRIRDLERIVGRSTNLRDMKD